MESIKQCIRSGSLPTLKYFKHPKTGEHKIISLPKVIIGTEQSSAEGLIRLWGSTMDNRNEKLKNHPIQSKIIMELLVQLKYFYKFAKNHLDNTEEENAREKYKDICIKYGEMYNYIYDLYSSKKELIESHSNEMSADSVFNKIIEMTKIEEV